MSLHKTRSSSSSSLTSSESEEDGERRNDQQDDGNGGSWVKPFIGSYHHYLNTTAKATQLTPVTSIDNGRHRSVAHEHRIDPPTDLTTAEPTRSPSERRSSAEAMMRPAVAFMPLQPNDERLYFHRGIGGRGNYHKVVPSDPRPTATNSNNVAMKPYPKTIPKTNGSLGKSLRGIMRGKKGQESNSDNMSDDSFGDLKNPGNVEGMVVVGGTGGAGVVSVQRGLPPSKQPLPYGAADKLRMRIFGKH